MGKLSKRSKWSKIAKACFYTSKSGVYIIFGAVGLCFFLAIWSSNLQWRIWWRSKFCQIFWFVAVPWRLYHIWLVSNNGKMEEGGLLFCQRSILTTIILPITQNSTHVCLPQNKWQFKIKGRKNLTRKYKWRFKQFFLQVCPCCCRTMDRGSHSSCCLFLLSI